MNMAMTEHTVTEERVIHASARRVFQAWTSPDLLVQWLADRAEVDAREGGHYRLERDGGPDDSGIHVYSGYYTRFVPDLLIEQTWVYNGPRPDEMRESVIEVNVEAIDESATRMRFRESSTALERAEVHRATQVDWAAAFARFERVLFPPG